MTRKILVTTISTIYMVLGFSNFSLSFFPFLSSDGFTISSPLSLIGSVLAFYAGLTMLRLNELGRKFVIVLLLIRVALNTWLLLHLRDGTWFGLEYFGKQIYRIENQYAYPSFLLIWIVIALLTIMFLSQRKTRKLFTPETIHMVDSDNVNSDNPGSDIFI